MKLRFIYIPLGYFSFIPIFDIISSLRSVIICLLFVPKTINFLINIKIKYQTKKVIFHIKDIFIDHWNNFLNKFPNLNIRQTVFDNIKRTIKCKTLDLGFDVFKCHNCGKEKICFHTCKSRLCSSCGNKYNNERQTSIFSKLFKFKHRHIVWTIP